MNTVGKVLMLLIFSSCSSSVVDNFLDAIKKNDFTEASKYLSEQSYPFIMNSKNIPEIKFLIPFPIENYRFEYSGMTINFFIKNDFISYIYNINNTQIEFQTDIIGKERKIVYIVVDWFSKELMN